MLGKMIAIAVVLLLQGSMGIRPSDQARVETRSGTDSPPSALTCAEHVNIIIACPK
jgi:hypothetical protein